MRKISCWDLSDMILLIYLFDDLRNICNSLRSVISADKSCIVEITECNELQILRRS